MYCNHRYHQHHRHRHPCRAHDRITCTMPLSARLIASLSQCSAGCTCVVRAGFLFFLLSSCFILRSFIFHLSLFFILHQIFAWSYLCFVLIVTDSRRYITTALLTAPVIVTPHLHPPSNHSIIHSVLRLVHGSSFSFSITSSCSLVCSLYMRSHPGSCCSNHPL